MRIQKLTPALKDYIWGGTALKERFGKQTQLARVAESWELSCHPDGESLIDGGQYDGMPLSRYLIEQGNAVLGTNCEQFAFFPVLIKLIDAQQRLSIQVHPNDKYASRVEGGCGKTEMWYVVDCKPHATLYYGFAKEITKQRFAELIQSGELESALNAVPVKQGDVLFIDAGTIHAIGEGILLAEIQQSSNLTYRVYDYNRPDADGKPRELHVQKALDVTITRPFAPSSIAEQAYTVLDGYRTRRLARCDYFTVHELRINSHASLCADDTSFHSLLCLAGEGVAENAEQHIAIKKGDSLFVPAGLGNYRLAGQMTVLKTVV